MSNNQPTHREETSQGKSKKSSTPSKDPMSILSEMLAPLIDFHKTAEESADSDLRIFWDVRIVRGKDTHFMHTTGSTTLPGILANGLSVNTAPIVVHQEIEDKVAKPIHLKLQQMLSDNNLGDHVARLALPDPANRSTDGADIAQSATDIARAREAQMAKSDDE